MPSLSTLDYQQQSEEQRQYDRVDRRRHSSTCISRDGRNPTTDSPTPYLILTNISKKQNVKNLLQIALAYGVRTIFVVGQKRGFVFDNDVEDNATDLPPRVRDALRNGRMSIERYDDLEECAARVRGVGRAIDDVEEARVKIIGVEITNTSLNIEDDPFSSSQYRESIGFAFMMGNEGSGMSAKQLAICDGFVRISQYGGGTASLNVSVAAGLVLHRFHHWSRGE